jgi:bifunctional DNA-binding transcriptional regulator/antitoxin component of YhaV-PrlF toxin-antitoxin module
MSAATIMVGRKWRITLSKELLSRLQLEKGDKLQFLVQSDGAVIAGALQSTHDASTLTKRSGRRAKKA